MKIEVMTDHAYRILQVLW